MTQLTIGLITAPRASGDQRLPLHPQHLARLESAVSSRLYLETGYGTAFGTADDHLAQLCGGICTREEIFSECDVILVHTPAPQDLTGLKKGQILWAHPHLTHPAEAALHPAEAAPQPPGGRRALLAPPHPLSPGPGHTPACPHPDAMAGYCSVTHALACTGRTGHWGPPLRAAVIGDAAAAQGAVDALRAQNITAITRLSTRFPAPGTPHTAQLEADDTGTLHAVTTTGHLPLAELLARHDLIVNCLPPHAGRPLTLLSPAQAAALTPGTLIVDVSRTPGTGFPWTGPTTLARPLRQVTDSVQYYAVPDSPSYLWNSATWTLSTALLPHLATVVAGRARWTAPQQRPQPCR
ncbi:alanine dehydrogenase [Streptomyces sp. NPDC047071]|uniref:alanine dehydrogenase n=1 Tax=Streptomyces sp. NPDC047071 TaxID=3154808 RepID=UPI00345283BF